MSERQSGLQLSERQSMASPSGIVSPADERDSNDSTGHEGLSTGLRNRQNLSDYAFESPIEDVPPPAYSETYGLVDMNQDDLKTRANITGDGRVNININQKNRRLSKLLAPLHNQFNLQSDGKSSTQPPSYIPPSLGGLPGQSPPPSLNVVIQIVGSRGDVQPFVALGQVLKRDYRHRVRVATHPTFRSFIEENGLEFFSIGGDPAELMAFMVKHPGLMPGADALRSGEIGKRRKGMYEIVRGCWRSCFEAGDGTGPEITDSQVNDRGSFDIDKSAGDDGYDRPFVAEAIIANPPSFAHIHCAEKLGIPLHMMFTMPWTPTQAFPHPLANIQSSNADVNMTNFLSYALVEMMTWQGLGDVINRFRELTLGLEPVSMMAGPGMASRLRIPYTYCWSPALIPKPKDWGRHISVSGFYFLSLASNYTPAPDLAAFLDAGPPPIYIGFGSIVVDDPNGMTNLIFEAVKITGQRALVSKGWGGFGADSLSVPEGVFMLGNVPHDWLFKRVSCVIHHGGAGTTAAGIALGKPTVVVPYFGDQPFWGAMVHNAGAGPEPIPSKRLTAELLGAAIKEALDPKVLQRATELGARISSEKGSETGAKSFNDGLDFDNLRCSLMPGRAAVWRIKRTKVRLSAFAAAVLGDEGLLNFSDLKLYRPQEYDTGPWDPISGATSALLGTMGSLMMGVADFPVEILKVLSQKSTDKGSQGSAPKSPLAKDHTKADTLSVRSDSKSDFPEGSQSRSPSDPDLSASLDLNENTSGLTTEPSNIDLTDKSLSSSSTIVNSNTSQSSLNSAPGRQVIGEANDRSSPQASASTPLQSRTASKGNLRSAADNTAKVSLETMLGTGKGIGRIVGAGLKSPLDFTLGLARGFHNAPRLYGDTSVRNHGKITDLNSGLRAAGNEFRYGLSDGIAGLVTHPYTGAKKEGISGFLKGFGMGIGGFLLKPSAAIWGLPGYTMNGLYKELQKAFGPSVQNYVLAARAAQGFDEWKASTEAERLQVISRWHNTHADLAKEKKERRTGEHPGVPKSSGKTEPTTTRKRLLSTHLGKPRSAQNIKSQESTAILRPSINKSASDSLSEHAIPETSTGNPAEDILIERAIRASKAQLHQPPLNSEAPDLQVHDSEWTPDHASQTNWDDSGVDTDDDENIKLALANSILANHLPSDADEDGELRRAIEESERHHREVEMAGGRALSEEEIVLEYIKKQSLAEEEHRKKMLGG